MIELIKELRSKVNVPISEAKELLSEYDGNVEAAFEVAMGRAIKPIVEATGFNRERVSEVFLRNDQNLERTIAYLKFTDDPTGFDAANKPTAEDLSSNLVKAGDCVYQILEACDGYVFPEFDELSGYPDVIQNLICFGIYYSHYHTDTDALLRYSSPSYFQRIESSLRTLGYADLAEYFLNDAKAIEVSPESADCFFEADAKFARDLRNYCMDNLDLIFEWQSSRNEQDQKQAEQASDGRA